MEPTQRSVSFLIATNVATLLSLGALVTLGLTGQESSFDEITAQRINIVSPEGKTLIAISNLERVAAPSVGGKTYPVAVSEGREFLAGMVFFNQEGDEMGGLLFNSFKMPNGRIAGIGHLSFDRYNDNQVLALQYNENASGVKSGMTVFDRTGDGSFKKQLDLIEEARGATATRRSEIQNELAQMTNNGDFGTERMFIGSRNRAAQITLKDTKSRVRARLIVDAEDQARLEFLDGEGKVTATFPQ